MTAVIAKSALLAWIRLYSAQYGVDPALAASIVHVESGFKSTAVGGAGERGLFQLHPRYFPSDAYFDARTNIREGIRHLAHLQGKCQERLKGAWYICYNLGANGSKRIKQPRQFPYFRKVQRVYSQYADHFRKAHERKDTKDPGSSFRTVYAK